LIIVEQCTEQLEALLAKVVAKQLEGHQRAVVT